MSVPVRITKDVLDLVMKVELDSGELNSFKTLASKKDETQTKFNVVKEEQTSGSKGFRIIGVMRDINDVKAEPVGYVLYNDSKKEHSAYSTSQVKMILGMYTFVNAKLENDKVVITDGAETALLQFDAFRNPIGQPTVYVLDRTKETVAAGGQSRQQEVVTFINNRLEVQKLPAATLIEAKNSGKIVIANMKVVSNGDTSFLEAKNVTTIPTYEKEIRPTQVKTDAAEEFRKKQLKMKNHASFVQRLVNIFSHTVIIKNSPDPECTYFTYIKTPCISQLARGLSVVGTKGLASIIRKEVIPALKTKRPELDFTAALAEIDSGMSSDGTVVRLTALNDVFINSSTPIGAGKDLERDLLFRYLYAFRLVDGLYFSVNTADIVRVYHGAHYGYKEPYIIDGDYRLEHVYNKMIDSCRYGRMPSWKEFSAIRGKFYIHNKNITSIIGTGIKKWRNHGVIWPLPFKARTNYLLTALNSNDKFKQFIPLLLHICSEATLLDSCTDKEFNYRKQRITVMLTALFAACHLSMDAVGYYEAEKLIFDCLNESTSIEILTPYHSSCLDKAFKLQRSYFNRSMKYDASYLDRLIMSYAHGAGLFMPYISANNQQAPRADGSMTWEFLFPGLKNRYEVQLFKQNVSLKFVQKKHKYGLCDYLDKALRTIGIDVTYNLPESSRHYERIQNHKQDKNRRWTVLTAAMSKAAVAQYLGRPYRDNKANPYHAKTLRLIYYVNTPSKTYRSKTHELY